MDAQQRTDEWFEARLGKATASRFKDVLATLKNGGESAGRRNYRAQLVVERLTGRTSDRFTSGAMDWGTETEGLARTMYKLKTGNKVTEVGFIGHSNLAAGASPDGMVGEDGLIEIKCLNTANHIEVLHRQEILPEYVPQVQGQLWITGREWCDFISFDPDMPDHAQLFIARIPRDQDYIDELEREIAAFLSDVDAEVEFVSTYGRPAV